MKLWFQKKRLCQIYSAIKIIVAEFTTISRSYNLFIGVSCPVASTVSCVSWPRLPFSSMLLFYIFWRFSIRIVSTTTWSLRILRALPVDLPANFQLVMANTALSYYMLISSVLLWTAVEFHGLLSSDIDLRSSYIHCFPNYFFSNTVSFFSSLLVNRTVPSAYVTTDLTTAEMIFIFVPHPIVLVRFNFLYLCTYVHMSCFVASLNYVLYLCLCHCCSLLLRLNIWSYLASHSFLFAISFVLPSLYLYAVL